MLGDDLIEQINVAIFLKELETRCDGCVVLIEVAIDRFADFADGALGVRFGEKLDNFISFRISTYM